MTEGIFIGWKKSPGETVARGDILAEVETDKANMELEAFADGTLLETYAKPGESITVGKVIGIIGNVGETPQKVISGSDLPSAVSQPETVAHSPYEPFVAETAVYGSLPANRQITAAAPAVRKRALEMGIDLGTIRGSGPGGRILLSDLDMTDHPLPPPMKMPGEKANIPEQQGDTPAIAPVGNFTPFSKMRSAIARIVELSWRTIPHVYLSIEADVTEAGEFSRELKDRGLIVTMNDLVLKAVTLALIKFPLLNSSFREGGVMIFPDINLGIAVSLDDGLLVPVLKGCNNLSLRDISVASHDLITRARSGDLSAADMTGGTFTVSNLGMYELSAFSAVILPPQAAILAVAAVRQKIVMKNGVVSPSRVVTLTLSVDHRILDGVYASRFLMELKRLLENPVNLIM